VPPTRPLITPAKPLGCGAGCAGSTGDPHVHPFNADPYEFQAACEFTLVRASSGAFAVQAARGS